MEREPTPRRKRWSVYRAPTKGSTGEPGDPQPPKPPKPAKPPTPPKPRGRMSAQPSFREMSGVGKGVLVVTGIVMVGIVAMSAFVVVAATSDDSEGIFGRSEVQVLTVEGVNDLVDAIEEKTGSTEVFSATIYPTYAVVRLPVDGSSQREIGYTWDGHDFEEFGSKGTSSSPRLDLADLDPEVLPPLVKAARAQVDEPNSWYVIINHDAIDDEGWISAYASNEYNEGGYILADRTGKEIRRTTW